MNPFSSGFNPNSGYGIDLPSRASIGRGLPCPRCPWLSSIHNGIRNMLQKGELTPFLGVPMKQSFHGPLLSLWSHLGIQQWIIGWSLFGQPIKMAGLQVRDQLLVHWIGAGWRLLYYQRQHKWLSQKVVYQASLCRFNPQAKSFHHNDRDDYLQVTGQ